MGRIRHVVRGITLEDTQEATFETGKSQKKPHLSSRQLGRPGWILTLT